MMAGRAAKTVLTAVGGTELPSTDDQLAGIASEREAAKAALADAESAMKAHSRDPDAFRKAKKAREEAVESLERLEWAEKAERERQEKVALQVKVDAMREAQQRAQAAHRRAVEHVAEVDHLADSLVEKVKALQAAQVEVERGVRYETFGVRDGYLDRQTIKAQLAVDTEMAVRVIRAGRELAILSGVPAQTAELKAQQGRL